MRRMRRGAYRKASFKKRTAAFRFGVSEVKGVSAYLGKGEAIPGQQNTVDEGSGALGPVDGSCGSRALRPLNTTFYQGKREVATILVAN